MSLLFILTSVFFDFISDKQEYTPKFLLPSLNKMSNLFSTLLFDTLLKKNSGVITAGPP